MADNSRYDEKVRKLTDVHCKSCGVASICLPASLAHSEMDKLDVIIERNLPLKKGDHVFRQGDPFFAIYAIRAGTLKTYTVTNQGEEQINGFYFPGELVALSAINNMAYPISAKALETTMICEIPYENLDKLTGQLPELRRQITNSMAKEIRYEQQMMMLLSKKTADERVATFLVKLSERFKLRGYSPTLFRLSMSRNEIGNYLGLAVETISRIFTRFQKQQLIKVEGKEIEILDLDDIYLASGERTQQP
jgi:CRP/FNR family transcriptional regulator